MEYRREDGKIVVVENTTTTLEKKTNGLKTVRQTSKRTVKSKNGKTVLGGSVKHKVFTTNK